MPRRHRQIWVDLPATFSSINMWDLTLHAGRQLELTFPERDSVAVLVVGGDTRINDTLAHDGTFVIFDNKGDDVTIDSDTDSHVLILNGEPLDQPIVAHGPFVMSSADEIQQATTDFETGRFGHLDDRLPATPPMLRDS
jgi:quercetin 2,3-dioxygenase